MKIIKNKVILFVPVNLTLIFGTINSPKSGSKPYFTINYIIFHNQFIITYLFIKDEATYFNHKTSILYLNTKLSKNYYSKQIQFFLKSLSYYFIKKIKFNGKSYRIEKKIFSLKFLFEYKFGHSLVSYGYIANLRYKHSKKSKLLFWFSNNLVLNKQLKTLTDLRLWNMYTQRGLRLNKQIIYKRHGKKSTYV